jgi:hypothetical protein
MTAIDQKTIEIMKNTFSASKELEGESARRNELGGNVIPFGVSYLDDSLGGIFKDDIVLIGGRSGGGKSELTLSIALNAAEQGRKVLYIGLEFSKGELSRRVFFSKLVNRLYREIEKPKEKPRFQDWMTGKQEHLFEKFYDDEKQKLMKILDNVIVTKRVAAFSIEDLQNRVMDEQGIDLFCLDHVHFFTFGERENENSGLKRLMQAISDKVERYDKPFVVVSHLRKGDRKGESIVPTMEDFHGGSDLFKISTRAVTIAPAEITGEPTHIWPTWMWTVKNRYDQGTSRFVGRTGFNSSENKYEKPYTISSINYYGNKTEDIPDAKIPAWAKGCRRETLQFPPRSSLKNYAQMRGQND